MIGKVTIAGKEYKTVSLWEHVRKINEKYGEQVEAKVFDEYTAEILMLIIDKNPFKSPEEIFSVIAPEEMLEIEKVINYLLLGLKREDVESEKKS